MKEEGLLTGSLLDYVNFTELLASTTHVQDEDAPAIAKVQRVLRRVIRETDDCQVVRKYKVGSQDRSNRFNYRVFESIKG